MSELLLGLWWNGDITSPNDGLRIGCLGLVLHRDLSQCPKFVSNELHPV